MTTLTVERLGSVLIAMASEARKKAEHQIKYHGTSTAASAVLSGVSLAFQVGAERCLEICQEAQAEDCEP